MDLSWAAIKEIFFAIGSAAGVIALFRPVLDKKHQRDIERAERLLKLLPEQLVVDLEPCLYQTRSVPEAVFHPFDQIGHELRTNQDGVRFSGPIRKELLRELEGVMTGYNSLRELVQVPEWEPRARNESDESCSYHWCFSKEAFKDENGVPRDYANHLDQCVDHAQAIARAYQRFQITVETHLLEVPVARWLLPRRYKAHGVAHDG